MYVDFSPWPFKIRDGKGRALGLAAMFQAEIARKTGLTVLPQEQTGILSLLSRMYSAGKNLPHFMQ